MAKIVGIRTSSMNEWCSSQLQDLCRLCGKYNIKMLRIFDEKNKHDFSKIINMHFSDFQVTESDALPVKLCSQCVASLLAWHEFYVSCININKCFHAVQEKLRGKGSVQQENVVPANEIAQQKSANESEGAPVIEVIEIKMDVDDEPENDIYEEVPEYGDEHFDIANIPISEDASVTVVDHDERSNEDSVKEEKLDTEEMAILENDLKVTTYGFEHLNESSNTVGKLSSSKLEKVNKLHKSTVCRICGKLYVTRTSYLRHLLKQHSNHAMAKRKTLPIKTGAGAVKSALGPKNTTTKTATTEDEAVAATTSPEQNKAAEPESCEICHVCGKMFRHKSTYRKHLRDQHSDEPRTVKPKTSRSRRMCDLCGKICSGGSFKEHMRKHTNPECVTCEHCGQVFSFVSVLKSHIAVRHSSERPYPCTLCDSSFKRADYLRSHMRYKHEPKLLKTETKTNENHRFRCGDCNVGFRTKASLERHCSQKQGAEGDNNRCPTAFQCNLCDLSFKKRNYLILHKRYVHEKNQPFRISEASVGPYKCDKCDRRFASVCGRNYHCKHTHNSVYETKFNEICDHCGLTFRNRVFYAKHCAKLREKPTCYLCWNAFETHDELKEHMHEVHVDDLPFLCDMCRRRFVTLRQLNDHIRSRHAFIRPFKCNYCAHTAVRKDSLEVHIRSCHLGEKPYKCDLCEKAFAQSSDLRKHRVIHTRNKTPCTSKTEPKYKVETKEEILPEFEVQIEPEYEIVEPKTCTDALVEQTTSINSTHASPKSEQQDVSVSSGDEILSAFTNQTKSVNSTEESTKEVLKKVQRRRLRICHLCGKHYTTDSGFRHHMVMHRDPSFSCHMCGRVFWESQNLKKHLAALHSEDRPFQCHMCGMKYKRRDVLQEHIKRVHDGIKKQWNEQMIRKYRSSGNTKTEVKKDRFQCPHCNKCMASKGYLEDHINGAHVKEPLYKCDQCAMTFTRKASFRYHFKRAHVQKKRILEPRGTFLQDCEFCGLQFRIKKYYDLHVAAKHLNKHPCEHCGEVFNNKGQRIAHIDSVHADEIAKCQICHKTFPEAEHLKRHIYLCHTERKPYECHTCGHKANKKSTLAVHMRRHTGEKPYQCDRCPRRFSQSVDYRKHRANHFKRRTEEHDADMKKTVECALETEEIGLSIECVGDGEKLDFEAIKTGNVHFM